MLTGLAGAKNSSNSNRLRETGAASKIPAFLIADKKERDLDVLRDAKTSGVTAGASAPEMLVENVIQALSGRSPVVSHFEFP